MDKLIAQVNPHDSACFKSIYREVYTPRMKLTSNQLAELIVNIIQEEGYGCGSGEICDMIDYC